jgi:hypothetical protein
LKYFFIFFFLSLFVRSQKDSVSIDPKYLEDQLYIGVTYNIFDNTPPGLLQDSFAYGFAGGFIKDLPFNKSRNIGMGIGFGYTFNTFIQNLIVSETAAEYLNGELYEDTYTIKTNSIEFPIEFRWRTSTLEKYKFWRIYTGINFSYVLNSKAIGIQDSSQVPLTEILELERFQYAYTLSAGYGTWNFYLHYTLNPFFKSDSHVENTVTLKMNSFKLGLIFYLL